MAHRLYCNCCINYESKNQYTRTRVMEAHRKSLLLNPKKEHFWNPKLRVLFKRNIMWLMMALIDPEDLETKIISPLGDISLDTMESSCRVEQQQSGILIFVEYLAEFPIDWNLLHVLSGAGRRAQHLHSLPELDAITLWFIRWNNNVPIVNFANYDAFCTT